jgi:hypothetical protein
MIHNSIDFKHLEIVSYFNENLRTNYTVDELNWQYSNALAVLKLQVKQGDIIGAQGMIPFQLNLLNQQLVSHKSESSFLNAEFRGQNIFESLYEDTVLEVKM